MGFVILEPEECVGHILAGMSLKEEINRIWHEGID
jgi:hypothetical protein